jgi:hypothetical protein
MVSRRSSTRTLTRLASLCTAVLAGGAAQGPDPERLSKSCKPYRAQVALGCYVDSLTCGPRQVDIGPACPSSKRDAGRVSTN